MRILHIITALGHGGAESVLYRLISSSTGFEHEVVSLSAPGRHSVLLEKMGIKVHHLCMDSAISQLPGLWRLRSIIRRSGADLIQCWMYRSNLFGGVLGRMAGIPVVWNIRCSPGAPIGRASNLLARLTGAMAGRVPSFVVNCSARSAEEHARIGFSAAEGAVIANGYDPAALRPDEEARSSTRQELGLTPDAFVVGSISRWIDYKDIPILLRALAIARKRGVDTTCLLLGHRLVPQNDELMTAIRESGGIEHVLPLGKRNDVDDLARAMDLHVLSSTTEAFPNVVAETMLSGTPNAVTHVGDAALIVGETGWVVPPRDPTQLADAINQAWREWKERPQEWQRRRDAARQRIVDNFSLQKMVEAYERVWTSVGRK